MTERDRCGVAAVFTADPHLQLRLNLPATLDADFHEFANTVLIDRHERIAGQNTARSIDAEEACGVIARNSKSGLREVIGAEREKLRALRDLAGHQTSAR
jgi:hypothetical protein